MHSGTRFVWYQKLKQNRTCAITLLLPRLWYEILVPITWTRSYSLDLGQIDMGQNCPRAELNLRASVYNVLQHQKFYNDVLNKINVLHTYIDVVNAGGLLTRSTNSRK